MSRNVSRWLALPLLLIAVVAFALAMWRRTPDPEPAAAEPSRVSVVGIGARPLDPPSQAGEREVRLELPSTPAIGRSVYVMADAEPGGDGTRERPLQDLQAALCDLGPGDRLIVWDGEFRGPFSIGDSCQDGTTEAPIEVYAAADSVLHGGGHSDEPVLTVARAHWRLHDLMVVPLESLGGGIVLRAPARDVVVDSAHVRSGRGNGIEIHPGVEDVVVRDSHLHHLGIQEGGGGRNAVEEGGGGRRARGQRVDPATTPPGAGIRIFPGTRGIRVEACEIRNIFGEPLDVVTPAEHDPALPAAADLAIDDSGFVKEKQERWW